MNVNHQNRTIEFWAVCTLYACDLKDWKDTVLATTATTSNTVYDVHTTTSSTSNTILKDMKVFIQDGTHVKSILKIL